MEPLQSDSNRKTDAAAGWTTSDACGLLLDGEIHNVGDLGRELGLGKSASVADVLLTGWQRWSTGLWTRLDGEFALAIRDANSLYLYRDPSGLRGLFLYVGRSGAVAFGTDLDRLVQAPGVDRRLAHQAMHEYLRFGDVAAPRTMYQDVIAVQAGRCLRWLDQRIDSVDATPAHEVEPAPGDFASAVARLDEVLDRAVRRRIENVERPAAFLSGGIDSALLCALGRRHRADLTAVTVAFDAAAFDESPTARRIAKYLGLPHEVLRFDRRQCLSALDRLCAGADQPVADPAAPSTLLTFEHCRGRFDAVLDGTGADEAVGMMPPRHVRLAVGYSSLLSPAVRRHVTAVLRALPGLARYAPLTDFEHPAELMIRWRGFARTEVEALCSEPVTFDDTHFYRTFAAFRRHSHFERYSALLDAMPSERLTQAMRISRLLVRLPYFEPATNNCIRQLRTDFKFLPGQPKRILRALLARHVPTSIWDGPKHGFDFPLRDFLAADEHALVRRYLNSDPRPFNGVVSSAAARRYAARFMAGDSSVTFRVWLLVQLGAWLEHRGGPT